MASSDASRPMRVEVGFDPLTDQPGARRDAELNLARQMMEILQREFPGYPWGCRADSRGGILGITIPGLTGPTAQFVVHIDAVQNEDDLKRWMKRAGGELLERFRLSRSGFNLLQFQDAKKLQVRSHKDKVPE